MKKLVLLCLVLLIFGIVGTANAALIVRGTDTLGNQLIYDDDLDITWYDYTNFYLPFNDQLAWAEGLSIEYNGAILEDWRLPITVDGPNVLSYDGSTAYGYNNTTSELGHLFYEELGNTGDFDTNGNVIENPYGTFDNGPFENFLYHGYYTGTESAERPGMYYRISTASGRQQREWGSNGNSAIAVADGDVAAVPEPTSLLLIGSGLVGMVALRKRQRG